MMAANDVTLLAARMSVPYGPAVPIAFRLLAYDVRRLDIATLGQDGDVIASAAQDVANDWMILSPMVIQKNGSEQAQRFDVLRDELNDARMVDEYRRIAVTMQRELPRMEMVLDQT